MIRVSAPRINSYGVWTLTQADTRQRERARAAVTHVNETSLSRIEESRPGYAAAAERYLHDGHMGILIQTDNAVAAMAWMVSNPGSRTRRVKRYYPLRPGHTLLHADWVHPEFRGEGMHAKLIEARLDILSATHGAGEIEANIEETNKVSIHNYERAGFQRSHTLTVASWSRWSISGIK